MTPWRSDLVQPMMFWAPPSTYSLNKLTNKNSTVVLNSALFMGFSASSATSVSPELISSSPLQSPLPLSLSKIRLPW